MAKLDFDINPDELVKEFAKSCTNITIHCENCDKVFDMTPDFETSSTNCPNCHCKIDLTDTIKSINDIISNYED